MEIIEWVSFYTLIHHATNHNYYSTSDNAIFYEYFYTTACILTSVRIHMHWCSTLYISLYCIVISSVHWLLFHSSCSPVEVCQWYGNHHGACCTVQYSGQALCHQLSLVQTVVVMVGGLLPCLSRLCTSWWEAFSSAHTWDCSDTINTHM